MANLYELFDNAIQFQDLNGTPLAGGRIFVYALGRTRLMDTWSDVDGESLNTNPIILDAAGQCHCYVSPDFDYTIVVCDEYNNEIFSLDKYIYSEGSHSHADVAVAPSENIAVSSYSVGETTVYVPYLTGQLGKVYEGVDPVNVDNINDRISVSHIPIGVQTPLFFVEDSETACIIGCSAQSDIPSALSGKWDEASDWVTGNSASVATTGDLNDLAISVSETYQPKGDYLTTADSANFYTVDNPSGFITGVDLTPYQTVAGMTAYATTGDVTGKLDSTAFSTVSGNFMTALPAGTMNESSFGYDDGKITAFNGSAFKAGDELPQSATDAINVVTANSGTWNDVTDKLDATAFSTVSGDFLTAVPAGYATEDWVTAQGYITGVDLTPYQTTAGMTAYQSVGNYYSASNPSGFITGVDLTPYQTTAGMTAYATKDDISGLQSASTWNEVSDTVATNSASWGAEITIETGSI